MNGNRLTSILLSIALLFVMQATVIAHEVPTHVNITAAALNFIHDDDPIRFNLMNQNGQIYGTLFDGSVNEDNFVLYPFGRFFFHFLPKLGDFGLEATCTSVEWGIVGSSCRGFIGGIPYFAGNTHTWQSAINAVDPMTGAPKQEGWTHLGYIIHLLEDLTSPPHTRNSAHPCVGGFLCDPFEPNNANSPVGKPKNDYINLANLSGPQDLFQRLQSYTHDNYFSARTVFDGDGSLTSNFDDSEYFYAYCLQASVDFQTCSPQGRRIAYKGLAYYNFLIKYGFEHRELAEIDSRIASDQFKELAPVAVSAVAALIRLYAPMLAVEMLRSDGTSTVTSSPVTGIDCGAKCSALFVNGKTVTLTAKDTDTELFSGWGHDCIGSTKTITIAMTRDMICTAQFSPRKSLTVQKGGAGTGTVTSVPTGISCGTACQIQSAPFNGLVQLSAVADQGSSFKSWSGDCIGGTIATTTVTVADSDVSCMATFDVGGMLTVNKLGSGNGTITSVPVGINCGATCVSLLSGQIQLTAVPDVGSTFGGWGQDCSGNTLITTINIAANKTCTATFNSPLAVSLNLFGTHNISEGPFQVQVVNNLLSLVPAPADITVTLRRDVISQCSGLLFSSNRTVTIPQGQTIAGSLDAAGRDPACTTLTITTGWTVLQAIQSPSTTLNLSIVPSSRLTLSIVR